MTDAVNQIIDERAATHGDPVFTHIRIAQVWSAILDHEVSAFEVALCMAGLKLVRAQNNPGHQDSRDDAQGYVRIADLIADEPKVLPKLKALFEEPTPWVSGESTLVHNHGAEGPPCNERVLPNGQRRGACLKDDGRAS